MRATVLLSISLCALSCGKAQNIELTAKLVNPSASKDWCGSGNPDAIRLDCAFDLGLYVVEEESKKVLQTVCVKMDADPDRKWGNLYQSINGAMAKLTKIEQGTVRIEIVGVEPAAGGTCDYEASVAAASFSGKSNALTLEGDEVTKRFDIITKCIKAFSPSAMCLP